MVPTLRVVTQPFYGYYPMAASGGSSATVSAFSPTELPLTESERADHALVRETRESSLANYAGSPSELGHGPARSVSPVTRKPTVSE